MRKNSCGISVHYVVGALIIFTCVYMTLLFLFVESLPGPQDPLDSPNGYSVVRQQPWRGDRKRTPIEGEAFKGTKDFKAVKRVMERFQFPECPYLERLIRDWHTTEAASSERPNSEKVVVQNGQNDHIFLVQVPGCSKKYMFKLSCRPYFVDWYGRQAWPEIVASAIGEFFGIQETTRSRGMILPKEAINWDVSSEPREECWFPFPDTEGILVGALMDYRDDYVNDPARVRQKCRSKDPGFLESLLNLNLLDFLVLNTDRVKHENWYLNRDGHLLPMDNGAWAMHEDQRWFCDNAKHKETLFENIFLFLEDKEDVGLLHWFFDRDCSWLVDSSFRSPVCRLSSRLSDHTSVKRQLRDESNPNRFRKIIFERLSKDIWFPVMTMLSHQLSQESGIRQAGFVFVRDLFSCSEALEQCRVEQPDRVSVNELICFVISQVLERYMLASDVIHRCSATQEYGIKKGLRVSGRDPIR
eukprot:gb/GECG01009823.1/.p1 GENE.gb/GECG01009823.1/~~gb/GECG01009823.1/.p1  ORF type:complete len:471 (+),score=38.88 gb/GECG01009823.1/:1-1413(+)